MVPLRKVLLQAILLACITPAVSQEKPLSPAEAAPSVDQILDRMRQHEAYQSKELKHYQAVRHYQVLYKGFDTTIAAKMDVEVNYDDASGKSFRILSLSGSKLLCEKVLKRAVESEKEASQDKQSTALTSANYNFRLTGIEVIEGRPAYVLHVEPVREGKFLYRGNVWVDAVDYAVEKIEVEPAKNPSFWITRTDIKNTNSQIQGMWLPQKNRSESKIRIGGTAVLTIDYGTYQIALTGEPQAEANAPASRQTKATETGVSH